MKHYIVYTGAYLPAPSANGACLDELLKELGKNGYYGHVISLAPIAVEYKNSYCQVYPTNNHSFVNQSSKIKSVLSKLERLKNYPLERGSVLRQAISISEGISTDYELEFALCNQLPESSGHLAIQLKRKLPNLKIFLYELDSLTDNSYNSIGIKRFFSYRNTRLEEKIYGQVDLIIHLKSHAKYYEQTKYDCYRSKSVCVDFPLISSETYALSKEVEPHDGYKMIYSGVLMKDFRSPEYLIRLVKELLHQGYKLSMEFYSRGDCENYLKGLETDELNGIVSANGYITKEILDTKTASADVLVSIGNNFKGEIAAVPSKPIYYMSLGKPILHIAPDHTDMALPYLERYSGSLIIYETDDFYQNVDKLKFFLSSLDGKLVAFETISETFKENTGKHTVDKILEML